MSHSAKLNGQTAGGAVLAAVSVIALVSTSGLETGSLAEIGPALIPRALAILLLILGAAIMLTGIRAGGEPLAGVEAAADLHHPWRNYSVWADGADHRHRLRRAAGADDFGVCHDGDQMARAGAVCRWR